MTPGATSAVLSLVYAADTPATPDSSNGPVVVVLVAVATVVGTAVTALGPTFLEIAKNRGKKPGGGSSPPAEAVPPGATSPPTPAPPPASPGNALSAVVTPGIDALSMLNAAVMDYRTQRDNALREVSDLRFRLEQAGRMVMDQRVQIGQLQEQIRGGAGNSRHRLPDYGYDDRWSG